jgi:hypothetical protein
VVYAALGVLHLFPFGARYSIVLSPLVVPLLACAFRFDAPPAQRRGAALAFALLCVACVTSLPNRGLHRLLYGEGQCVWPETEDIGPVTKYWVEHRTPDQPTYVYYGAAPAFAYYVDRYSKTPALRAPGWFLSCWRGDDEPVCRDGGVFYGTWVRTLEPGQKFASMFETMGRVPDRFWFVAAHSQQVEDIVIGRELQKQYHFVDVSAGHDAVAVLLQRNVP